MKITGILIFVTYYVTCTGQDKDIQLAQSISDNMFFVQGEKLLIAREGFIAFNEKSSSITDSQKEIILTNSLLKIGLYYTHAEVASMTMSPDKIKSCEHRRMNLFARRLNEEIQSDGTPEPVEQRLARVVIEISQYNSE
jgi:hypothetical protein